MDKFVRILENEDWFDAYEDKERLVRCKDCNLKHYSESGNLWCDIFDKIMPENGFCSFAEGGNNPDTNTLEEIEVER